MQKVKVKLQKKLKYSLNSQINFTFEDLTFRARLHNNYKQKDKKAFLKFKANLITVIYGLVFCVEKGLEN